MELKIKDFTFYNYFKSFDAGFFELINKDKKKDLIIDLRDNPGGYLSIGIDIMRYLVAREVVPLKNLTTQAVDFSFNNYIVAKGSDTISRERLVKSRKGGFYVYNADNAIPSYQLNQFSKNVFVLVNKGTFSAASIFAANLRSQRRVVVIGEETGGGEAGTDGSGFSIVKTPKTHLLLRLPNFWISTTTKNANTGHGLIPDIIVKPTIADRINNNDVVLKKALSMISDK